MLNDPIHDETAPPPNPTAEYQKEILAWRTKQDDRMRSAEGWLALTGHYWLSQGNNTIGPTDDCNVVLPKTLTEDATATIHVARNKVRFSTVSEKRFLVDGMPVRSIEMDIDDSKPESDSPTQILVGERVRLQLVRRNQRLAIRVRDADSELIQSFQGKKWFDIAPQLRIEARFEAYDPPRSITIGNVKGDSVPSEIVGKVSWEMAGVTYSLDALSDSPDSLFILFRDKTSGVSTYGPGRFIDTERPVDGKVILDFNKAYNPPCAFNPHTLCPIPPKQNRLDFEVPAGERYVAQ